MHQSVGHYSLATCENPHGSSVFPTGADSSLHAWQADCHTCDDYIFIFWLPFSFALVSASLPGLLQWMLPSCPCHLLGCFCMGMAEKRRALGLWAQWWSDVSYNCRLHWEAWFQEGATLPVMEEDLERVACGSFQAGCSLMLESQH